MAKLKGKYIEDATIEESKMKISNAPVNDYVLVADDGETGGWKWAPQTTADAHDVKVSANDTTPGFLSGKVLGTTNVITITENNDGGNETITIKAGTNLFNTSTDTTTDITEGTNLYYTDARVSTWIDTQKGAASGLATLDASSKIPTSQLPALAITETYTAVDETAQLALTVQEGDVCVRTDENKSYIALNSDNVDMGDWQELLTPTDLVLSVNGEVGAVTLDTDDISEGTNKYFATSLVDAHLSGGTGITYSTGAISIDTTANLNFTGILQYNGEEVLTSVSGVVETKKVEVLTLDGTDITNKYIDLAQTPVDPTAVSVTPVNGIPQTYTDDFTVISNGSVVKRVNWATLGMESLLEAADKLMISYTY